MGVNKKKARTATVAHDAPPARIRIIRQTAHATAVASTTSVIAAGHQCVGASTVVSPATKNAPGMKWPSWLWVRYSHPNTLWVEARPIRIKSSQ